MLRKILHKIADIIFKLLAPSIGLGLKRDIVAALQARQDKERYDSRQISLKEAMLDCASHKDI